MTNQPREIQTSSEHSEGSLLLGALFGGLTSEIGQAADMAMDVAEVASEFHTHFETKSDNKQDYTLGRKNSLNSLFGNKSSGMAEAKSDIQTRYLNMNQNYVPRPSGMALAA